MFRQRLGTCLLLVALSLLCANVAWAGGYEAAQRYGFDPLQKHDIYAAQKHVAQKVVAAYPAPVAPCVKCCHPRITYRHHACCKRRPGCSCW